MFRQKEYDVMYKILQFTALLLLFTLPNIQRLGAQQLLMRPGATVADMVIDEAKKHIGTPYRWGGKSPKGFDCAGFTRYVYAKFGVSLAPSAAPQYKQGTDLKSDELQKGDLVFYGGSKNSHRIGHVGIVTSVDESGFSFIHASNSGVRIDDSSDPYYKKRYIGACRVVEQIASNHRKTEYTSNPVPVYRQSLYIDTPAINYLTGLYYNQ